MGNKAISARFDSTPVNIFKTKEKNEGNIGKIDKISDFMTENHNLTVFRESFKRNKRNVINILNIYIFL